MGLIDELKTCRTCERQLPATTKHFGCERAKWRNQCRDCDREYGRAYNKANREKLAAKNRAYGISHRTSISINKKEYAQRNRDSIRAKRKASYYANHQENLDRNKQNYWKHREERRAYRRAYYESHREELKAYSRERSKIDREKRLAYNKKYNKTNRIRQVYGISPTEYQGMIDGQGGVCALCFKPPRGNGPASTLHIDHDHATGKVRGLLCHGCNKGLGHFYDNTAVIERAVAYLAKHRADDDAGVLIACAS